MNNSLVDGDRLRQRLAFLENDLMLEIEFLDSAGLQQKKKAIETVHNLADRAWSDWSMSCAWRKELVTSSSMTAAMTATE
jgi:hypothetical protein